MIKSISVIYPVCNEELYGITNELVGAWVRHLELFENSSNLMNTTTPLKLISLNSLPIFSANFTLIFKFKLGY